jgi:serine phosphatase RsbU (regulator of sigma subunit)
LLVRADGTVEDLSAGGLLLGAFAEATYRRASVTLAPGDRLLLYTDGLSEAADGTGGYLGREGILRLLEELSDGAQADRVPERLLDRTAALAEGPEDESDDRTLVLLARLPG